MSNPWLSVIAALSGKRLSTPLIWPVREVHRLCDVRAANSSATSRARQSHRRRVSMLAPPP
jgi:hypothetical protein